MSAIIPEEFNIATSFLFEGTVFNNPFRLRRSQILVARRRCAMHFGFDSPRNNFAPTARKTPEPHRSNNIAHLRSAWKNVTVPHVNFTGIIALKQFINFGFEF